MSEQIKDILSVTKKDIEFEGAGLHLALEGNESNFSK